MQSGVSSLGIVLSKLVSHIWDENSTTSNSLPKTHLWMDQGPHPKTLHSDRNDGNVVAQCYRHNQLFDLMQVLPHELEPMPDTANVVKNLRLDRSQTVRDNLPLLSC